MIKGSWQHGPFFIIYSPLFADGEKINFRTPKMGNKTK